MSDHPTTPTPAPGDPVAARYAELRKLGWTPSAAFQRAYEEMLDAQTARERAWLDDADDDTPGGGAA